MPRGFCYLCLLQFKVVSHGRAANTTKAQTEKCQIMYNNLRKLKKG